MIYDLKKINDELNVLPVWQDQICLQGTKTNKDPFAGIGKGKKIPGYELEFKYPLFDMPYINSIIKEHNLYRVRIMKLKSKTCYSYHQDPTMRIHIPLITNDNCFMIIDEKVEKLREGITYHVDTTKMHTAINAGKYLRFHMVFCLPPIEDGRTKNQLEFDLE